MKYVKTNKIIAFILSMVMILSNILPNISNDVFGINFSSSTNGSIEPVVEYSDSGQTEPERETTGTDLDNFEFSLKYGTIEEPTENDTLFVKDQSNKINATLRIEYRGEQSYNAGDLSMTFNYPTGIYRNNPNYDMLSDVGAELKGSGSGRGDWYYEKELGKLTFTNKNATTGSFTSSIEIVLEMSNIRNVITEYNSTMNASFGVNGIDSVLNSKALYFSTETTHDEMELDDIKTSQYHLTTYSKDSSTYESNGYKLNDYYVVLTYFYSTLIPKCRGYKMTDTITVPEGCFIQNTNSNVYVEESSDTVGKYAPYIYIYIPKNKYTTDDKITIRWNKSAVFFDKGETWEDTLEKSLSIYDNDITVKERENIESASYKKSGSNSVYYSQLGENRGTTIYWNFVLRGNNYGIKPKYTEIIDEDTYLTKDTTRWEKCRDFNENEYYLKYIKFYRKTSSNAPTLNCNTAIYAKRDSDLEYTLIDNFIYNGKEITQIDIDPSQKYTDFKIAIDGNWVDGGDLEISVGAFVNVLDFSNNESGIRNTMNYKEITNDDETITKCYNPNGYIYIKDSSAGISVSSNNYGSVTSTVKDSKIQYKPSWDGRIYTSYDLTPSDLFKIHKLSFDVSIPLYMNFGEIKKEQFSFKNNQNLYKENDNSLVSKNTIPENFYDLDYNIKQDNNQKVLSVEVIIKDGYYLSGSSSTYKGYFNFKPLIYLDFDLYSNLLNIGKLPNKAETTFRLYKCEEFQYAPDDKWGSKSASYTNTLTIPSLAGNTYQGVEKFVNTGSGFTKDLSATTPGGDYSYKLRIAGGETTLDNIVLYDNLEEAYGDNSYWKGTFNGLDTTLLDMICEGEDYNYTVYYSKDKNQVFDLSDAGWVKEADWSDSLADVKSIAIDLGGIRLNPKSLAYVIVNMKAPENSNPGLKAYNSYAADYKAYDSTTGNLMETIKALPSNTTEVIYNKNITYTVNKVWDGKASDSVEIKLFANGTEKETITLNADNQWKHTFTDLPALDDNFSPIEYTVEETALKLYNASYETITNKDGNITTTIVNTRVSDIYTITKVWNINSEKIKIHVKTENGYDAECDYINILDSDGTILEKIDFEKLGLIISKNEYKTDKTYTAEVHMPDGKIYTTPVNIDKFTPAPIECDLYIDEKVVDTFTLNEENGWKYTTTIPYTDSYSVVEKTTGAWKCVVTDNRNENNINFTISNNVDFKIDVATITISDPEPPVDTGNSNYLWVYLMTLGIGFAGILISKKKK